MLHHGNRTRDRQDEAIACDSEAAIFSPLQQVLAIEESRSRGDCRTLFWGVFRVGVMALKVVVCRGV